MHMLRIRRDDRAALPVALILGVLVIVMTGVVVVMLATVKVPDANPRTNSEGEPAVGYMSIDLDLVIHKSVSYNFINPLYGITSTLSVSAMGPSVVEHIATTSVPATFVNIDLGTIASECRAKGTMTWTVGTGGTGKQNTAIAYTFNLDSQFQMKFGNLNIFNKGDQVQLDFGVEALGCNVYQDYTEIGRNSFVYTFDGRNGS